MKEFQPKTVNKPFCLLDLSIPKLEIILGDEKLAKELTEFNDGQALSRIDELIAFKESEQTIILLNKEAILAMRDEWTIRIPEGLSDSIYGLWTAN